MFREEKGGKITDDIMDSYRNILQKFLSCQDSYWPGQLPNLGGESRYWVYQIV